MFSIIITFYILSQKYLGITKLLSKKDIVKSSLCPLVSHQEPFYKGWQICSVKLVQTHM